MNVWQPLLVTPTMSRELCIVTLSVQEHTVDRFIPNDTYIADGSRVALVTGANCSGKSVYLKQVSHKSYRLMPALATISVLPSG